MAQKISRLSDILKIQPNIEIVETASKALENLKRRKIFRKISNELLEKSEIASLKGNAPKIEKVFPMLDREMLIDCIKLIRKKNRSMKFLRRYFRFRLFTKTLVPGATSVCFFALPAV